MDINSVEDKKQFAEIMYALAENYGAELTKPGLLLRFEALKGFSADEIRRATVKIMRTRAYLKMPTVADFLQFMMPGEIGIEDRAHIECGKVIEHLQRHGSTREPEGLDEISTHLMTRRWPYRKWARTIAESELQWWEKQFRAAYLATAGSRNMQIEATKELKQLAGGIGNGSTRAFCNG